MDNRVEWEADLYIQITWLEQLTVQQVKTLREVDSNLKAQPLAPLLQELRSRRELLLGPYLGKSQLDSALNKLRVLGFDPQVKIKY